MYLLDHVHATADLAVTPVTSRYQPLRDGRSREVTSIADLACGHGLVGVLLAYRFPHRQVC